MSVWTDATIALLQERLAAGDSASQIAAQLGGGISRNAVIGKIHRLGIQRLVRRAVVRVKTEHPKTVRSRQKPSLPRVTLSVAGVTEEDLVAADIGIPMSEPAGPGVTIHALDNAFAMCRWIVQRDSERLGGDRYCGEKTVLGCSWCAWHKSMTHTRETGTNPQPKIKPAHKPSLADRSFGAVAC